MTAQKAIAVKNADPLHEKQAVIRAMLSLCASIGWQGLTLTDIAEEAEIPLSRLSVYFDDKNDILIGYGRMIDKRMLEEAGEGDASLSVRDRLFDLMMERFDILNEDRTAVLSILDAIRYDPKQALYSLPHLTRSVTWMLEAAGEDTNGVKGALKVAGLSGVYTHVLRAWMKDESPDMSATMASLDKALSRVESLAGRFNF
ncbi:MAG: TetR family transcriptional regulator [Pseudobdellovibrionaceae bacterium]